MKMDFKQKWLPQALVCLATLFCVDMPAFAMERLDDQQLSDETGQSAFYTNYIGPTDIGNPNGATNNIGFFTLGLNGVVSLNANINHLQLGCGGVNGAGCDIDLSQVRLTGTTAGPSGTFADSDGTLTNPFLQLAISNPTTLSTRHVVGIAFGAQAVNALLSVGQNPETTIQNYTLVCNSGTKAACTTATVATANRAGSIGTPTYAPGTPGGTAQTTTISTNLTGGTGANCTNANKCTSTAQVQLSGGETGINTISGNFQTKVQYLDIPVTINANGIGDLFGFFNGSGTAVIKNTGSQPAGLYSQYVSGQRMTGINLGPIQLDTSGVSGVAGAAGGLGISVYGSIIPQNLIDVHNLAASSTPTAGLLLSLNSIPIYWPQIGSNGTYSFPTTAQYSNSNGNSIATTDLQAQKGWWLTVPAAAIGGTSANHLTTATATITSGVLASLGSPGIALPSVNIGQVPVPNCYNGARFC